MSLSPLSPSFFEFDIDDTDNLNLSTPFMLYDMSDFLSSGATDNTPFHESDSGLSDPAAMSTCSSVSPTRDTDIMLDELLDNGQFRPFGICDNTPQYDGDSDDCFQNGINEDVMYDSSASILPPSGEQKNRRFTGIANPAVLPVDCGLVGGVPTVSVAVPKKKKLCRLQAQLSTSSEESTTISADTRSSYSCDQDFDVEENDVMNEKSINSRQTVKADTPHNLKNPKQTLNNVKVVRVVRTQHDLPNTPDEVVKALEERNRKNAQQAKANRLRKKNYVGSLENEVREKKQLINQLEKHLEDTLEENSRLKTEVEYLKAVLSNQSALADLLKNIPNSQSVRLSSFLGSRKRTSAESDHDYSSTKRQCLQLQTEPKAGVCLHVDSNGVSLEFCHHCSEMSRAASEFV